jgi:hypothetical protein
MVKRMQSVVATLDLVVVCHFVGQLSNIVTITGWTLTGSVEQMAGIQRVSTATSVYDHSKIASKY